MVILREVWNYSGFGLGAANSRVEDDTLVTVYVGV
jgi:hypothetical protein